MGCRTCVASREATTGCICLLGKKMSGKVLYLARMKRNSLCHLCSRVWRPAHETIKAKGSGRGITTLAPHSFQGQLRERTRATGTNPMLGIVRSFVPSVEDSRATGDFSHKGDWELWAKYLSLVRGQERKRGLFFIWVFFGFNELFCQVLFRLSNTTCNNLTLPNRMAYWVWIAYHYIIASCSHSKVVLLAQCLEGGKEDKIHSIWVHFYSKALSIHIDSRIDFSITSQAALVTKPQTPELQTNRKHKYF